jgi:Holliday junction resolvase RusA-like endonuclease
MLLSNQIIENEVAFTVPHLTPPSVNHYKQPCVYRGRDGQRYKGMKLTPEAKAFKLAVAIFARGRTVAPVTNSERSKVRYSVIADVYLGKAQRLDADNCGKLLLDGLQDAGVIHSDAFVEDFRVRPHKDDRENPRTEFIVSRIEEA